MNIARYLLLHAKSMRGMTVVHVGAHFGQEARRYQNMLAEKVVWIEASPEIFLVLKANIAEVQNQRSLLSKVLATSPTEHVCINALISEDGEKQVDFHVFSNAGASNSIFKLNRENDMFRAVQETGQVLK